MTDVTTVRCYVQEYSNSEGKVSARLREKATDRRVLLEHTTATEGQDFLRFLSAAHANRAIMPDLFDKFGEQDCVVVSGHTSSDEVETIVFLFDAYLSYRFE